MFKQMKLKMLATGMALVLPTMGWGEVNFYQKPLAAGGGVDPNLMFMLDDSGSMRFGFMPEELMDEQIEYEDGDATDNLKDNCANSLNYDGQNLCVLSLGDRYPLVSPSFNKLYYNPEFVYEPPLKADGTPFPDASFSAAKVSGFDSESSEIDLATEYTAIMDDYYYDGRYTYWFQWRGRRYQNTEWRYGFSVSSESDGSATGAFYYEYDADGCSDRNSASCYEKRTVPYSGSSMTADQQRQNFANWFSYYRTREMAAKSGIGTVFANPDLSMNFRLGWGEINKSAHDVDDADDIRGVVAGVRPYEDVKADFLSWLYDGSASGATPLQRALEGAGQYYEKSKRAWLDDPAGEDVASNPARECRISATMLMTDGYYNTSPEDDPYDDPGRYTPDLTENADNESSDEDITNDEGASGRYYAVPPFKDNVTDRVTLADIAAYYWKRDLREDIDNYVPTVEAVEDTNSLGIRETVGDPAFWQHMMTYGIGFGVEGTVSRDDAVSAVLDGTAIDWWDGDDKENKINDLLHASMNGRGDFFSAADPATFQSELEGLLDQFLGMSGSATGLDFNVANIEANAGSEENPSVLAFSASFEPNGWSGELKAVSLEVGENGIPEEADPEDNEGWLASERLAGIDFAERTVLTYDGSAGVPFRWGNLTELQEDDLEFGDASLAQLRVDYLRGKRKAVIESENEGKGRFFRDRSSLLGSIVNSTPRYVGPPDSGWPNTEEFVDYVSFVNSNQNRTPVVYVGANDGMLHGFRTEDDTSSTGEDAPQAGDEVLAYVPSFVSSAAEEEGLHYLTQPGFEHRYYVDLNLEVVDVYTKGRRDGGNGITSNPDWRTVLIGGARAGAKGIFALDITNPDNFSEDNAEQTVLWEFTHPKLGYLVEPPEIAVMEWPDGEKRWTAFVPSGYNSGSTGFFMLDLEGGLDGEWTSDDYMYHEFDSSGSGLSPLTVVDHLGGSEPNTGDYMADRIYAGDLEGNLWVAKRTETGMETAYEYGGAKVPYFRTSKPITSAPAVTIGAASEGDPDIQVMFGTGKYLEYDDISNTDDQYFFSIWDSATSTDPDPLPRTIADLQEATLAPGSVSIGGSTRTGRRISGDPVDLDTQYGWYMELPDSGERIVNYPVVRIDPNTQVSYVYVNTLIPGANPCLGGGDGYVMGFEALRTISSQQNTRFGAFKDAEKDVAGFRVGSAPSQLSIWGDLIAFGTGSGGSGFVELPEIVIGLGRKGWREMTE